MNTFNIIYPSFILRPYIKYYWTLELESLSMISERVIPDGCMHLIFHKHKPLFSIEENSHHPQSFIGGQTTNYTDVKSDEKISMLVVVFHPQGVKPFFSIPMSDFQKKNISIDDLSDHKLKEVESRVQDTQDIYQCVHIIEEFLIKRLTTLDIFKFNRIKKAIQEINKESMISTKYLSDVLCLSYKQFNRVFTEHIGINPKEFIRVVRFQRALYILQTQSSVNLTELAYLCGFYDQSHFIKEFKAFSGYTPTEYIAICNPHSDYFSL